MSEEVTTVDTSPVGDEVAVKARGMGWVPEEEWKGDPEKWRPAAEFVQRGENIVPILRDRVSKLEADLKFELGRNAREIEIIKKESYERAKTEYEQKLAQIDAAEIEAFKAGDTETYMKVKAARNNLAPPTMVDSQNNVEVPEFTEWKSKNPWYQEDPELRDYADFVSHKIVHENRGSVANLQQALEDMAYRTKKAFPHKFTNLNRNMAGAVEGPSNGASQGNKNGNSFNDLPDTAKSQYRRFADRFKQQGREFSKEEYAREYFAQQ